MVNSNRTTFSKEAIERIVADQGNASLQSIGEKVIHQSRISPDEGLLLFEKATLAYVGSLANHIRESLHGDKTYFNRNFHI